MAQTFPYPNHRKMDRVIEDEAGGCLCEMVEEFGDADDCGRIKRLEAEADW